MIVAGSRFGLINSLPPDSIGAEVGVQRGDFSEQILKTKVNRVYLVDCWQHQPDATYDLDSANVSDQMHELNYQHVQTRLKEHIASGRAFVVREMSHRAALSFQPRSLDWVYLDGNHAYEWVMLDLILWSRVIKPGGFLMGHDYVISSKALFKRYGVYDAVNDWCAGTGRTVGWVSNEEWPSFAIKL